MLNDQRKFNKIINKKLQELSSFTTVMVFLPNPTTFCGIFWFMSPFATFTVLRFPRFRMIFRFVSALSINKTINQYVLEKVFYIPNMRINVIF